LKEKFELPRLHLLFAKGIDLVGFRSIKLTVDEGRWLKKSVTSSKQTQKKYHEAGFDAVNYRSGHRMLVTYL
jgi:hypothetical protein